VTILNITILFEVFSGVVVVVVARIKRNIATNILTLCGMISTVHHYILAVSAADGYRDQRVYKERVQKMSVLVFLWRLNFLTLQKERQDRAFNKVMKEIFGCKVHDIAGELSNLCVVLKNYFAKM
jgi:hypothetical protein